MCAQSSTIVHIFIKCFRGWHRGVQFYLIFAVLRTLSFAQQNESFLLKDLHPREGNPLKHPLTYVAFWTRLYRENAQVHLEGCRQKLGRGPSKNAGLDAQDAFDHDHRGAVSTGVFEFSPVDFSPFLQVYCPISGQSEKRGVLSYLWLSWFLGPEMPKLLAIQIQRAIAV